MQEDADGRRVLLMVLHGWTPSVPAAGLARGTFPTWARLAADHAGEPAAVDARVADRQVVSGRSPSAFDRLQGGLTQPRGDAVSVAAPPGLEFAIRGQRPHRRGRSHGSLHRCGSVVPLRAAAAARSARLPAAPSILDVEPLRRPLPGIVGGTNGADGPDSWTT